MLQLSSYICYGGPYDGQLITIQTGVTHCRLPRPLAGDYRPGCAVSQCDTVGYVVAERNWIPCLIYGEHEPPIHPAD